MKELELIAQITDCTSCELSQRGLPVPFAGEPGPIVILGEAPGEQEDKAGAPFVGPAGELLRRLLQRSGIDPGAVAYVNTVSCLEGRTPVFLSDGQTREIRDLVRQRYQGDVLSVDESGQLVAGRVTGWQENPRGDREMYSVKHMYDCERHSLRATGDHELLTEDGWVRVDKLEVGARLHSGMLALESDSARQVVLSGLLGDATVERRTGTQMEFCASGDERDYLEAKRKVLEGIVGPTSRGHGWPRLNDVKPARGRGGGWRLCVTHPEIRDLYEGHKDFPHEAVEELTDFGLALWYMDDGHLRVRPGRHPAAQISVARMSPEKGEWIAEAIRAKGIPVHMKVSSMGPRLMFGVEGTRVLMERIGRYAHPAHVRKFVTGVAPCEWPEPSSNPLWAPAAAVRESINPKSVYCLSVDRWENFVTTGGVVHNCWPQGSPSWDHIRSCERNKLDQLDYLNPTFVLLLGKVALRSMRPDLDISQSRSRPFIHDGRICFASFHPAAALRNGKYERGLKRDLDVFRNLVDSADWQALIPDDCSRCEELATAWEATSGLGWCETHMPEPLRGVYDPRRRQQIDELDAARRRDEALGQVADAADPSWMAAAWDAIVEYLKTHQVFFVDDFWIETELERPRESRALGPVVLRAAREGLMKKSGEFRPSTASNMTAKPCWTSLIYQPKPIDNAESAGRG